MNYRKNYEDYINYVKTLNRFKKNGIYYEEHHIIPKKLGGNNNKENLILLTAREHYLAHYLLWKIYNDKMFYSFYLMNITNKNKIKLLNSKIYEKLKLLYIEKKYKKVFCKELNKEFKSVNEASQKTNSNPVLVAKVCRKEREKTNNLHFFFVGDEYVSIKNKVKRKVINLDTGEIFDSITDAAKKVKLKSLTPIKEVCRKKRNIAAGYHWCYLEDKNSFKIRERRFNPKAKRVINLDTGEIFDSAYGASKFYNLSVSCISSCCNKKYGYKTSGGFRWEWYYG
jgi:hypothetical protein